MIILDIETVARPDAADFLDDIEAPANYRDPEKIAAYIAEAKAKALEKAAANVDLCRIIGCGCYDEHAPWSVDDCFTWAHTLDTERDLVFNVWTLVNIHHEATTPITFGGLGFDWPVLARRSQILGVKIPHWFSLDRYRSPLAKADLAERLTFNGATGYKRSLRTYCRLFGIPVPDEPFTGADVPRLYAEGRFDDIANKNTQDLQLTRLLAEKLGVGDDVR